MLLIYDRFIAVDILGRERRPEVDNVIEVDARSGALEMLNPGMKSWGH